MKVSLDELQKLGTEMLKNVSEICESNKLSWFMAYGSALGAVRHNGPIPWDYDIDIFVPESELGRFLDVMNEQLSSEYWVDYREGTKYQRSFPRIGIRGHETEVLHIDVYRLAGLPVNPIKYKLFMLYSRILFVISKSKIVDIDSYYPDKKRRIISKFVKGISFLIPLKLVLKELDKQANRIPLEKAKYASCPFSTIDINKRMDKRIFDESILVDYSDFKVRIPKKYDYYLKKEYGDWKQLPPKEERERSVNKIYEIKKI